MFLYHYWVTQNIDGCESERARLTITVIENTVAPYVDDVQYCKGSTSIPLTAQGHDLLWYTMANGG